MNELLASLPHRQPFLFVSEVVYLSWSEQSVAGAPSIRARWNVVGDEAFLAGHFPDNPVVPGVLITESLAQAAGLLLLARAAEAHSMTPRVAGYLVQSSMRFRRPVHPPATLELAAMYDGGFGALIRFNVEAHHNSELVADGTLVLSVPGLGADIGTR